MKEIHNTKNNGTLTFFAILLVPLIWVIFFYLSDPDPLLAGVQIILYFICLTLIIFNIFLNIGIAHFGKLPITNSVFIATFSAHGAILALMLSIYSRFKIFESFHYIILFTGIFFITALLFIAVGGYGYIKQTQSGNNE